ncbi:unnamed protein product [Larinioides sclopetarius]|uniref:Uncharacterized protein n=1 Tax=Larinioides sclopetarius TaxID=280406 RepID=A0AAV1ZTV2_9ARAC
MLLKKESLDFQMVFFILRCCFKIRHFIEVHFLIQLEYFALVMKQTFLPVVIHFVKSMASEKFCIY